MHINVIIIAVTVAAGVLGFVVALLLLWKSDVVKRATHYFLSFAVGAMLAAVFFDLLPESFELHNAEVASLLMLVGILFSFVVEKFVLVQHYHGHEVDAHCHQSRLKTSSVLVIIGDFFHNFLDGVLVAASFLVSIPLGISAAIAEIAHELPQEVGDFSILIAGGMKRSRVIFWNVISELGSVLGAVLVIVIAGVAQGVAAVLLPIAAGNFLYIAMSDLIPELHHQTRVRHAFVHVFMIAIGIGVMFFVGELIGHE